MPRNWGKNLTVLAALTVQGILLESVVWYEGATSQALFEGWVEQVLVPHLKTGQIVLMDNLSAHTGVRVRELIEGAGCELEYLPAYSPDLSPIEMVFSKVKAYLRRLGARSLEPLVAGWHSGLSAITGEEATHFFTHCGYPVPVEQ